MAVLMAPFQAGPVREAVAAENAPSARDSSAPNTIFRTGLESPDVKSPKLLQLLTPDEKKWLDAHRQIRLGVEPAWPPFEYIDDAGVYQGIASDVVRILNQQLQIDMAPVAGLTWSEVMQGIKAGKIDVLPCAVKTPERSKYLLFTQPYLKFPMVILTRLEAPFIEGIENIIHLKVMVVKNYASHEIIQQDYPGVNLHLADTIDDALKALSKGRVDAFVGNMASITFTVQKLNLTNLKVASTTPDSFELSFAVRPDWPELIPILNKSLSAIPSSARAKLLNNWIHIRFERHIDWRLVGQIVGIIITVTGLVFIVILRWNRALAREIGERTKTEDALRKSEERIRTIFDNATVGMGFFDNQGRLVQANACWIRMMDYAIDNLRQLSPHALVHPDDREESQQLFAALLQGDRPNFRIEQRFVRKDDSVFWGDLSVAAVKDEAGAIQSVIGMLVNISERKKAELDMRKLWRAIEEGSTSIMITDRNGRIEYVNPRFIEITGYSPVDAIGQTFKLIESDRHPAEFYQNIQQTIKAGKEWRGEMQLRRKNGDIYWSFTRITPVRDENAHITHFISAQDDITEEKRMDQELIRAKRAADEASNAKSEFLANMSHEIRTPMNAIIGLAHLAQKTDLTTKQRDYINKIQSSADALLMIINDILDFSKIEAGKLAMESVDFHLDEVLDNLSNLITIKTQDKKNLEVLFDVKNDVPRRLVGDPIRLGQILINLGSNAVKFTHAGEIIVSITRQQMDQRQVTQQFEVSDTGIGMSPAQVDQLFQAFTQADTSTTRKFGGTGLGLTISQRLVHMMQGQIWAESQPGKGSTFHFSASFGLGREPDRCRFRSASNLKNARVLVVDDNDTARQIFQEILSSSCLKVATAASGAEGLTELVKTAPDAPYQVVLMDWKMPQMDGLEAARRIKNHPLLQPAPAIIMVTNYGREDLMHRSEDLGLDALLVKPVSPDLMLKTISQTLQPEASVPAAELPPPAFAKGYSFADRKILLVEDNGINQQVALEILENSGADVAVAGNGVEALNMLQSQTYDIVLMDIQMPVMDGYEATRKIRQDSRFLDLPIIAMTAHAMTGDRRKSLAAVDLQQAAMNIEKAIKPAAEHHQPLPKDIEDRYARLLHAFNAAIDAIQTLQPSIPVAAEQAPRKSALLPETLARQVAERLQKAANIGDIDGIAAIADELRSQRLTSTAERITLLADEFDFEGILMLTAQLKDGNPN
jgi:polar amino acid transport system substrate-binding protein